MEKGGEDEEKKSNNRSPPPSRPQKTKTALGCSPPRHAAPFGGRRFPFGQRGAFGNRGERGRREGEGVRKRRKGEMKMKLFNKFLCNPKEN